MFTLKIKKIKLRVFTFLLTLLVLASFLSPGYISNKNIVAAQSAAQLIVDKLLDRGLEEGGRFGAAILVEKRPDPFVVGLQYVDFAVNHEPEGALHRNHREWLD